MSVKALEEFAPPAATDDFQALEQKIYRTIELLKTAREAKANAERTVARLRENLAERDAQLESMRSEMVALRRDREEVRTRVEKMLKQIDALTTGESGA